MNDPLDLDDRIVHIRSDALRLATCLDADSLTTPIPSCPDWDLRTLGVHTGFIHRWATQAVRTAAPPAAGAVNEPALTTSAQELAAWMRLGSGILVDFLAVTRPSAPTWHPFPAPQIADIWSRRMMIETALHRWDAEYATTGRSNLDPRLAATGIEEYFELGLPRMLGRTDAAAPTSRLIVHSDVASWTVTTTDGLITIAPGAGTADGSLNGTAEAILLMLMGRADGDDVTVDGNAAEWLDVPSW